jgi:hypothetical protein
VQKERTERAVLTQGLGHAPEQRCHIIPTGPAMPEVVKRSAELAGPAHSERCCGVGTERFEHPLYAGPNRFGVPVGEDGRDERCDLPVLGLRIAARKTKRVQIEPPNIIVPNQAVEQRADRLRLRRPPTRTGSLGSRTLSCRRARGR